MVKRSSTVHSMEARADVSQETFLQTKSAHKTKRKISIRTNDQLFNNYRNSLSPLRQQYSVSTAA